MILEFDNDWLEFYTFLLYFSMTTLKPFSKTYIGQVLTIWKKQPRLVKLTRIPKLTFIPGSEKILLIMEKLDLHMLEDVAMTLSRPLLMNGEKRQLKLPW